MKDESSPVTPDEFVVRLIWSDFYKPEKSPPVRDRAFLPRADETDGISVFRAACVADPRDVLAAIAPGKRDKYRLALIPVAELAVLGLSVVPAKIDAVPGHAVIPELNTTALTADADQCLAAQKELARLAARNMLPPAEPKS